MSDWPRDEYDAYLGHTLSLLESGAPREEIVEYLASVELEYMGMSETPQASERRKEFAKELQDWFTEKWLGTHA